MPCIPGFAEVLGAIGVFGSVKGARDQAKSADKAQKAQAAALNAQSQLSAEQWQNFKEDFEPAIKELVAITGEPVPTEPFVAEAMTSAQQAAEPVRGAVAQGFQQRGISPVSLANVGKQSRLGADIATRTGLAGVSAAEAARDLPFNRRLGLLQIGRGIPGDVLTGLGNVARQRAIEASEFGQGASDFANLAVQIPSVLGNRRA